MTKELVQQAIDILTSRGKIGKAINTSGENIVFNCPFTANHGGRLEQRTPSFAIHEEGGMWQCFSCGRRAPTIYALYSQLMGISEEEAHNEIGEPRFTANMVLDRLQALKSGVDDLRPLPMEPFPHTVPAYSHPSSANYLRNRNIPEDVAEMANLQYFDGYSLPTFSGKPGMSGKRILFPLEHQAEIVGYSARAISDASWGPKYYRPVTNVNSIIYNPARVSPKTHRYVFVVEGEFSCLACLREKLPTICTFGANVSRRQAEWLVQFDTVIFLYDPDVAGDIGAGKAFNYMNGYTGLRKFILPGVDPADMLPGFGETLRVMAETPQKEVDKLDLLSQSLRAL